MINVSQLLYHIYCYCHLSNLKQSIVSGRTASVNREQESIVVVDRAKFGTGPFRYCNMTGGTVSIHGSIIWSQYIVIKSGLNT
jgi:hypothetical protein